MSFVAEVLSRLKLMLGGKNLYLDIPISGLIDSYAIYMCVQGVGVLSHFLELHFRQLEIPPTSVLHFLM